MDFDKLIFVDETFLDSRISRNYARSKKGTRAIGKVSGKRGIRYSILAGLLKNKIIAPFSVEGSCNSDVFKFWIENVLASCIQEGYTVILDNVAFHKSASVIDTFNRLNINFIFLPPYSPELNDIEKAWSWIKARVKKVLAFCNTTIEKALFSVLSTD